MTSYKNKRQQLHIATTISILIKCFYLKSESDTRAQRFKITIRSHCVTCTPKLRHVNTTMTSNATKFIQSLVVKGHSPLQSQVRQLYLLYQQSHTQMGLHNVYVAWSSSGVIGRMSRVSSYHIYVSLCFSKLQLRYRDYKIDLAQNWKGHPATLVMG